MTSPAFINFLASTGSGLARLLRSMGVPDWALWVLLGVLAVLWFVRRFAQS
ncbi:MAG: hypothetical protein QM755_23360 [Luteolibacter sp.]